MNNTGSVFGFGVRVECRLAPWPSGPFPADAGFVAQWVVSASASDSVVLSSWQCATILHHSPSARNQPDSQHTQKNKLSALDMNRQPSHMQKVQFPTRPFT
jgi:hypothetical protein